VSDEPGRRIASPVWLVLGSIVSVQAGAALAKNVFGLVDPTALVWLRLTTAAIVVAVLVRPTLRGRTGRDWLVVAGYATTLIGMNWAIYQAMARIPLGVAVTIEFLGPLAIAVLGSRRVRDLVWVALAAGGVVLLGLGGSGVHAVGTIGGLDPVGVGFAVVAAACWGAYILLGARTGQRWSGLSGLAVALVIGAVVLAPPALAVGGTDLLNPYVIGIGVLVGLLSSVIPYSLELVALRRIRSSTFGILMSVEPAAAALAAVVVLQEWLTPWQVVAMALVIAASVGAARSAGRKDVVRD